MNAKQLVFFVLVLVLARSGEILCCTADVLDELPTATASTGDGTWVNEVAWQQVGSSYYVVSGGYSSAVPVKPQVQTFLFDPATQSLYLSGTYSPGFDPVNSVAWQQVGSSYYVALGISALEPTVQILQFDPMAGVLSALPSATYSEGEFVFGVAWQVTGTNYYLATTSQGAMTPNVRILQFDPTIGLLSELPSATVSVDAPYSVAWQQIGSSYYVAVADFSAVVRILQFDPTTGVLSAIGSATYAVSGGAGTLVSWVAWQAVGSSYYLGLSRNIGGADGLVQVLQFDPTTNLLNELPSATVYLGAPNAWGIDWQQIGSSYYLAIADDTDVRVLQFDPTLGLLSELLSASVLVPFAYSVAWQQIGSDYYIVDGNDQNVPSDANVRVFQFTPCFPSPAPTPAAPTAPASELAVTLVSKYNSRVTA